MTVINHGPDPAFVGSSFSQVCNQRRTCIRPLSSAMVFGFNLAAMCVYASISLAAEAVKVPKPLTIHPSDIFNATLSSNQTVRMFRSLLAGKGTPSFWSRAEQGSELAPLAITPETRAAGASANAQAVQSEILYYPADLVYGGGSVLRTANQNVGFLNCTESCWGGGIQSFIIDLDNSSDIHVVDQYVGASGSGRYPLSTAWSISWTGLPHIIHDSDAQTAVRSMVVANGSRAGLNNIYHLFLPPGQDICFTTQNNQCYSPDNASTFAFCGYHSAVFFSGIGWVLYTVEPYDFVSGCYTGTQNATSAQASVLGHEIFETITDPFPASGWHSAFPPLGGNYGGEEIGDDCAWHLYARLVGSRVYVTQLEYSNAVHACSNG